MIKWLLAAFAIETLCSTYGLKIVSHTGLVSFIYFIAGAAIPLIILFISPRQTQMPALTTNRFVKYFRWIVFILMMVFAAIISRYWFDCIPIDVDYADMLPVIRVMNERFLDGQWRHVYDNIPEIWNGTSPVYLPAMWLAFSPSILFHFDMRWITVCCLLFGFSVFLFKLNFGRRETNSFFALLIAFILYWWLFAEDDSHGLLTMSEEGAVILYYCLLTLALFSRNMVMIGIATSLCILSRYALIGWVPAFILYLLLHKQRKETLIFICTGIACFLLFFILPFGWDAFARLVALPDKYIDFASIVWKDSREVFWLSLGFAKFFGPSKTEWLHYLLIVLTFVVPLLFVISCYYLGQKKKLCNVPLATLKISIVVFFNFIDVPYLYLFYTSSFVSLIVVASLISNAERLTQNA